MYAPRVPNLLIPAEVLPRLDMPPVALSTGAADPVWLDLPAGRFPYDHRAAAAVRRARRTRPVLLAVAAVVFVLYTIQLAGAAEIPAGVHLFGSAGLCVAGLARLSWQVPSLPVGVGGDVYLAAVPEPVAAQWVARNPGVLLVDRRPVVRRFRPRFYTAGAVLFLIAAVQVVIVLAVGGVSGSAWLAAPALVAAGVTLGYRSVPFGHVRFTTGSQRPAR
ncbi:hypothetical protein Ari01nite_63300 [Paractinoplanes rishiriensis]|uniref:Uncharacterized protein n=1 Tax=Paractinoplanes rishiriensis TaxID=1050105 RepID=A0A919K1E1_9ACTN|nr:hypothetical protein Ari01nite_63300 [Actinoplanes rishiriensis]